jgi:hypothetical protein
LLKFCGEVQDMTSIMGIAQPIIVDLEWVVAATGGGWGR